MNGNEKLITFNDQKRTKSQQTIVMVLKHYKYYFKHANDYNNKEFFCYLKDDQDDPFDTFLYKHFHWLGVSKPTIKDNLMKIEFGHYNEPIVFTQEDVLNIINDIPENYVGEQTL